MLEGGSQCVDHIDEAGRWYVELRLGRHTGPRAGTAVLRLEMKRLKWFHTILKVLQRLPAALQVLRE